MCRSLVRFLDLKTALREAVIIIDVYIVYPGAAGDHPEGASLHDLLQPAGAGVPEPDLARQAGAPGRDGQLHAGATHQPLHQEELHLRGLVRQALKVQ